MVKRALIIGPGGMYGAYSCGATYVLGKRLGRKYFHKGYACSAGAYPLAFFFSGQYETLKKVLRCDLDGKKFIDFSFFNVILRKSLKLDYMEKMFKDIRAAKLNINSLFNSGREVIFVATNVKTAKPEYIRPNKKTIYKTMTATCSLPLVSHVVKINGFEYMDGGLTDPLPVNKSFEDGCDEALVLCNYPKSSSGKRGFKEQLERLASLFYFFNPSIAREIFDSTEQINYIENSLKHKKVTVIRPSRELPLLSIADTKQEHIDAAFDLGMKDAETYVDNLFKNSNGSVG